MSQMHQEQEAYQRISKANMTLRLKGTLREDKTIAERYRKAE